MDKLGSRIDKFDDRMNQLNEKIDSKFKWTMDILISFIGVVVVSFLATISIILSN